MVTLLQTLISSASVIGVFLLYSQYDKKKKSVNEVFFFPDKDTFCYNYFFLLSGCGLKKCKLGHNRTNASKICEYLLGAKTSINVCMFIFSNEDLIKSLKEACGRKGVKVRILLDKKMAEGHSKKLNELKKLGAIVLLAETRFMLHHKFAVIDNEVIINGSYNWTNQATLGNYDNCLITNKQLLVQPFITEFERLWKLFSDPVEKNAPLPEKFRKNPKIRCSAWDGIYVNNETPDVPH